MTIWDGVRPLRIEIHGQPERQRYWAEVEIGGMQARRVLLDSPAADGLLGMLRKVQAQFEAWEPLWKKQAPPSEAPAVEAAPVHAEEEPESEAKPEPHHPKPEPVAEKPAPRRRGRPPRAKPHEVRHEPRGHD